LDLLLTAAAVGPLRRLVPGLTSVRFAARLAARDEHSSLAEAFCTVRMRKTVGYARELMGGNGILLDHNVGRFVATPKPATPTKGTAI
jgi:alkylation response protein AidB-like acyl-CoA dehydrogenase